MPTICHFDIPAEDIERAKKFYTELFNWKIEKQEGPTEYWLITTTTPNGKKGISGGIEKRQSPRHRITCHIDVSSVEKFASKVEKLGGRIFVPKTAVPGKGYYAYCLDTEDNYFVIWETNKKAK